MDGSKRVKGEQIRMLPPLSEDEDVDDIIRQVEIFKEYAKKKRRWENAFQKWSDSQWNDGYTTTGKCGYGSMCDWCEDNSYGRPCIRALNARCRDKRERIDYEDSDFAKVWNEGGTKWK